MYFMHSDIIHRRIVDLPYHGSPPPSGKPTAKGRLFGVSPEHKQRPFLLPLGRERAEKFDPARRQPPQVPFAGV